MRTPVQRVAALITPTAVFAGMASLVVVLALYFGRHTTFWFDEWTWIAGRRAWTLHVFLEPHNEHLSILPLLVYKLLFVTVGLGHYWPYRVVLLALYVLCAWLLFVLVRRRLGGWEAAIAAGLILFLGASFDNFVWAFQITYLMSIATGLGALLCLERDTRRGDVAATALLVASLASSGLGVPIGFGIGVELLLRGDLRRRWWIVVGPAALYVLWYAVYGRTAASSHNILLTPGWALDAAAAAFGSFAGGGLDWGRPLLVGGVAGAAVWVVRRGVTPRFAAAVAVAVSFWLLTGVSRAQIQPPDTSRYIHLGALMIVLAGAEVVAFSRRTARALVLAGIGVAAVAALNLQPLREGGTMLRDSARGLAVQLGALELARSYVDPGFVPSDGLIPAREYFAAFDAFESPPVTAPETFATAAPAVRTTADEALTAMGGVAVAPGAAGRATGRPPQARPAPGVTTAGACVVVSGAGAPAAAELTPAGRRLVVAGGTAGAQLFVRRWGDGYPDKPLTVVPARSAVTVTVRPDRIAVPWRLQVRTTGRARACTLG